jgi:hypothetical protein
MKEFMSVGRFPEDGKGHGRPAPERRTPVADTLKGAIALLKR